MGMECPSLSIIKSVIMSAVIQFFSKVGLGFQCNLLYRHGSVVIKSESMEAFLQAEKSKTQYTTHTIKNV